MKSPFPGMDPYLEHPALWQDVHDRLIAAVADALVPAVAPNYYVGIERRAYLLKPDDLVFVGRPDVAIMTTRSPLIAVTAPSVNGVLEVEVPMTDEVSENFLEVCEVKTGRLVTLLEILSPTNKQDPQGREQYLQKRTQVMGTRTHLVEIDLLRAGAPMPLVGKSVTSDYRILVSRSEYRPRARLYYFSVRKPIPAIRIPLLPQDGEPELDLNTVLHELYRRARFDLRLDYTIDPVPPLSDSDAKWATALLANQ